MPVKTQISDHTISAIDKMNKMKTGKGANNVATAICRVPTLRSGAHIMPTNNNQLRSELEQIVEKIIGLRQLATSTGFMTFKEQRAILERLSSDEKAWVGRALAMRDKEQTK
jgi:hypothetical protein